MRFYELIRWTHVAAGAAALLGFWLTAALRKGSGLHRRTGQFYLLAMVVVMATAVPIAVRAFLSGQPVRGTFLAYLVVVTLAPNWLAWRAIRDQRDIAAFSGTTYRALAALSVASGAAVLAAGLYYGVALLIGFSLVGLVSGAAMLRFAAQRPDGPRWWLAQHYGAVIGGGTAAHIAFLNLGVARLLPPGWGSKAQAVGFFAPVLIALLVRLWLDRRYGMPRLLARIGKPVSAWSNA